MTRLSNRIKKAIGVNAYAQSIALCVQLMTVPILLSFWGLQQFGTWTYCMAISVYFGLLDFGFMAAGMNKISILAHRELQKEAQCMVSALWKMFFILFSTILSLVALIFKYEIINGASFHAEIGVATFFLIANALIAMTSSIFDAIFRANDRYIKGTILLETIRLIEWLSLIGSAAIGGGIVEAAFAMFVARLFCTILLFIHIEFQTQSKYINSVTAGKISHIYQLKSEAISWSAVRYGESISLQGPIILATNLLNPSAAGILSSYRTISRAALQFSSLIGNSLWPEFSRAMAINDKKLAKLLMVKSTVVIFLGSVAIALIVYSCLDLLLAFWGRGKIPVNGNLLGLFFMGVIVTATWYPARIFLMASAALTKIGLIYFLLNILGFVILYFSMQNYGEYMVPLVGFAVEIAIGLLAWRVVMHMVGKHE